MPTFEGHTVLVTGASRGLGRIIAVAFARAGAYVYAGYHVREAEAAATLDEIRNAGGDGATIGFNVRDRGAVAAAVSRIVSERPSLDILINNAGRVDDNLMALMSDRQWEDVLSVNLTGVFNCCKAVISHMIARRKGVIVNVCSIAGMHASPGQVNYAASKGGLLALTRTMASEVAARGIRVNAVVPGLISTGMAERLDHRVLQQKRENIALKRLGDPEEVAQVVLFLASDQSSYIVGQAIIVDGGLTL